MSPHSPPQKKEERRNTKRVKVQGASWQKVARAAPAHGVGQAFKAVAPKSTGFAEFNKKVKTSQRNLKTTKVVTYQEINWLWQNYRKMK